MYKRHQVMDLFHGNRIEEIGEWKIFDRDHPRIKEKSDKVKVKFRDGTEKFSYYYPDKLQWIVIYGQEPAYFWDCKNGEPLNYVTHWKELRTKND